MGQVVRRGMEQVADAPSRAGLWVMEDMGWRPEERVGGSQFAPRRNWN